MPRYLSDELQCGVGEPTKSSSLVSPGDSVWGSAALLARIDHSVLARRSSGRLKLGQSRRAGQKKTLKRTFRV